MCVCVGPLTTRIAVEMSPTLAEHARCRQWIEEGSVSELRDYFPQFLQHHRRKIEKLQQQLQPLDPQLLQQLDALLFFCCTECRSKIGDSPGTSRANSNNNYSVMVVPHYQMIQIQRMQYQREQRQQQEEQQRQAEVRSPVSPVSPMFAGESAELVEVVIWPAESPREAPRIAPRIAPRAAPRKRQDSTSSTSIARKAVGLVEASVEIPAAVVSPSIVEKVDPVPVQPAAQQVDILLLELREQLRESREEARESREQLCEAREQLCEAREQLCESRQHLQEARMLILHLQSGTSTAAAAAAALSAAAAAAADDGGSNAPSGLPDLLGGGDRPPIRRQRLKGRQQEICPLGARGRPPPEARRAARPPAKPPEL